MRPIDEVWILIFCTLTTNLILDDLISYVQLPTTAKTIRLALRNGSIIQTVSLVDLQQLVGGNTSREPRYLPGRLGYYCWEFHG